MADEVLVQNNNGVQSSQLHDDRCTQPRQGFQFQLDVSWRRDIVCRISRRIEQAFRKRMCFRIRQRDEMGSQTAEVGF